MMGELCNEKRNERPAGTPSIRLVLTINWHVGVVADNASDVMKRTNSIIRGNGGKLVSVAREAIMSIDVDRLGIDDIVRESGYDTIVVRDAESMLQSGPDTVYVLGRGDWIPVAPDLREYTRTGVIEVCVTRTVAVCAPPHEARHVCEAVSEGDVARAIDPGIRSRAASALAATFDGHPDFELGGPIDVYGALSYGGDA